MNNGKSYEFKSHIKHHKQVMWVRFPSSAPIGHLHLNKKLATFYLKKDNFYF